MECIHGITLDGDSPCPQCVVVVGDNLPPRLAITLHDQEPLAQLISAILDLLNHQSFDILPDEAKQAAFNFVGGVRRYSDKPTP